MKAIFLGIISAFFFSFTFVLNQSMSDIGGDWLWTASLRYIFVLPMIFLLVALRQNLMPLFKSMRDNFGKWFIYSQIGVGAFYLGLSFASMYAPGWLVTSTWQLSIITGSLMAPLFYETATKSDGTIVKIKGQIPWRGVGWSCFILIGIILMLITNAQAESFQKILIGVIPIVIAAFSYPFGNRKVIEIAGDQLDVLQRILGMTICSMPTWIISGIIAYRRSGWPSTSQLQQGFLVALLSGVLATILFFKALDMGKSSMALLSSVEATQATEVAFSFLLSLIMFPDNKPNGYAWIGLLIITFGIIAHTQYDRFTLSTKKKNLASPNNISN